MSNHTIDTSPQDETPSWNISQLFLTIGLVGTTVAALMTCTKIENTGNARVPDVQKPVIKAFIDKSDTFQGLPIIRIGNPKEMHTLNSQRKDGWYVFQEGNTFTYWKIQSGIIELNTYTLTK